MRRPVALVTGAAGGIGAAVVARLAADGWAVAAVDLAAGALADVSGAVCRITADVTDERAVDAAVSQVHSDLGGIGALVTCAGLTAGAPAHETAPKDWHAVLDANLTSAFLCVRQVLPVMMAAGGGVVVTIGSVLHARPAPGLAAYAAAKAGLAAFTRSVAVDYGQYGVRALTISPGWIATPATESRLAGAEDLARLREAHPLARLGEPADVAAAVGYAVGSDAALLNGTEVVLDGGVASQGPLSVLRPQSRERLGLPPLGR